MFVVPEARGRGVAGRLVDAVLADARQRGVDRVVLEVVEANTAAVRAYGRVGFRPTGRTAALPHSPQSMIEMQLLLR